MGEVNQNLSIQDLRAMIHGLRMANFAFVDQDAKDQIIMKIQSLPNPEMLGKIADTPKDFEKVVKQVGEIMKMIEIYSKRDGEYRARFKSKKKLPPRYKVLEWKNKKMETSNTVKTLVKFSARMDEMGIEKLAEKSLVCAKKIQDMTLAQADVDDFIKEAGNPMWSGIKDMFEGARGQYNVGNLAQQLKNIVTKLDAIKINLKKREPRIKLEHQKERLKKIEEQIKYMIEIGKANYTNLDQVEKETAAPQAVPQAAAPPVAQGQPQASQPQTAAKPQTAQRVQEFMGLDPSLKNEILKQLQQTANSMVRIYRLAQNTLPQEWVEFITYLNKHPEEKKAFVNQVKAQNPTQPQQQPSSSNVAPGVAKGSLKPITPAPTSAAPSVPANKTNPSPAPAAATASVPAAAPKGDIYNRTTSAPVSPAPQAAAPVASLAPASTPTAKALQQPQQAPAASQPAANPFKVNDFVKWESGSGKMNEGQIVGFETRGGKPSILVKTRNNPNTPLNLPMNSKNLQKIDQLTPQSKPQSVPQQTQLNPQPTVASSRWRRIL